MCLGFGIGGIADVDRQTHAAVGAVLQMSEPFSLEELLREGGELDAGGIDIAINPIPRRAVRRKAGEALDLFDPT
ncbi:hypothetical protein D3C80_1302220 [compost metagenome]